MVLSNDSNIVIGNGQNATMSNILNNTENSLGGSYLWLVSCAGYKNYFAWNSYQDFRNSLGGNPFYKNEGIYDSYNTTSGDYTVDSNNVNNITYGDVITYKENNPTASMPDIQIYINNNIPDNSGGGSGGEGGGGSGGEGSGSNTGIFDFLSELGSVLGNLISNLGQALTNIIRGISELITSLVEDLPSMFFDFIGAFFGWMPDEWVMLLSLSLACMLIFGIVKIFKG